MTELKQYMANPIEWSDHRELTVLGFSDHTPRWIAAQVWRQVKAEGRVSAGKAYIYEEQSVVIK